MNIPFELSTQNRSATVSTHGNRSVSSPAAFIPLGGLGAGEEVTKATLFFAKTSGALTLRVTFDDGSGGDTVSIVEASGLFVAEASTSKYIKLVEAKGNATIEYFASGNE